MMIANDFPKKLHPFGVLLKRLACVESDCSAVAAYSSASKYRKQTASTFVHPQSLLMVLVVVYPRRNDQIICRGP
jgi:hypothetical protein